MDTHSYKNGVLQITLPGSDVLMSYQDAIEKMQKDERTQPFALTWRTLYGQDENPLVDISQHHAFLRKMENTFQLLPDSSDFMASLNAAVLHTIAALEKQLPGISPADKDILQSHIPCLQDLLWKAIYTRQKIQAEQRMAAFRACSDFKTLIETFGDEAVLMKQYRDGATFAPNKKKYLELRINTLVTANNKWSCTHRYWWPTPEHIFDVALGEYKRIGYAWVMGGFNASWNDLDTATLRNITLNNRVPLERRNEIHSALVHYLISGGALAYHISFLEQELDSLNYPTRTSVLQSTVHRVHFDDFSGETFERLVFAYLLKAKNWDSLQWLGQSGSDGGRDIWGVLGDQIWCYQCANHQQLSFQKIKDDIDKLAKNKTLPTHYVVFAGGKASAELRDKIQGYCANAGITHTESWSGAELEEMLRAQAPELLRRFVEGEPFPE